jgi:peptide/nickel transport system permease protein
MPKIVFLWTDVVIFAMVACLAAYCVYVARDHQRRATWSKVFRDAPAMCAAVVLLLFSAVTLLDSFHFRRALPAVPSPAAGSSAAQAVAYSTKTESLLDVLLKDQIAMRETTYSVPFAYQGFTKDTVEKDGKATRDFTRLQFAGAHLKNPAEDWVGDLVAKALKGLLGGLFAFILIAACISVTLSIRLKTSMKTVVTDIASNNTDLPIRAALITVAVICAIGGPVVALMDFYHVLGTDRTCCTKR